MEDNKPFQNETKCLEATFPKDEKKFFDIQKNNNNIYINGW